MTRDKADAYAAAFYGNHPAAAALLLETWHGSTEERRKRSAVALAALDLDVSAAVVGAMGAWAAARTAADVPAPMPGPLEGAARAMTDLIVHIATTTDGRAERKRLGDLLAKVCHEAAVVAKRQARAA